MFDLARENSYPTALANSALLPIMLLSLATQKHSPSTYTADSILTQYDFIIVGAGSAGSALAGRLSEIPCINVLLLEAGPTPPLLTDVPAFTANFLGSDIDWTYKTAPQKYTARLQKERRIPWPSGKSLGGSSIINSMLYVRGNRQNYNNWASQGASGWSYQDVLPYFKKLENNKNMAYVENGYHGVGGPVTVENFNYNPPVKAALFEAATQLGYSSLDSNGARQTGFYDSQGNTRNQQRCSTAKAYLVPADNRTNLHILPNAHVHKVLIENGQAVGVLFEVNGTLHQVKTTREVIMSAGTVNTAQLLMLSGIGPKKELKKHEIPLVKDLPVGENFHNQVTTYMGFMMDPRIPTVKEKVSNKKNILDYIKNRKGPLCSYSFLSALAFLNTTPRPSVDFPRFQLDFREASVTFIQNLGVTKEAFDQAYKIYEKKPTYFCGSTVLQPRSRGYVRLQSSDPHAQPLIDPRYFEDPRDLQDVVEGMKTCYKLLTSESLKRLGFQPLNNSLPGCEQYLKYGRYSDEYFECHGRSIVKTRSHQVGTAKMGRPSDPSTVVDPELRVKGVQGLRVVDASVMPIIPSGNTNIPTIMVAEKAADIIKASINCLKPTLTRSDSSTKSEVSLV